MLGSLLPLLLFQEINSIPLLVMTLLLLQFQGMQICLMDLHHLLHETLLLLFLGIL